MNVLNRAGSEGDSTGQRSPQDLGRYLQQAMLQIKTEHMDASGRGVDYQRLASSKLFTEYLQVAHQLVDCDPTPLSEQDRMAFFINIYNCLTIHGLASAEKLPASVLDLNKFWKHTAYSINGMIFSLDDIEHGVLRGNRPHPSSDQPPFGEADPRRAVSMKQCDPRIHFTLVCGAKSCPAIQVYSARNLERGLAGAAVTFCSQEVEVVPNSRKIRLNKIFLWYGSDFGSNERELLQFVSHCLADGKLKSSLEELLASNDAIEIEFKDYNWQLNKL